MSAAGLLRPLTRAVRAPLFARKYHAPLRDMRFQLYTVHDFEKHYAPLRNRLTYCSDRRHRRCRSLLHPPRPRQLTNTFCKRSSGRVSSQL